MCGIAGWVGSPDVEAEALARMCEAIRHRGPDDVGTFVVPGKVALGFRRLSIIDLATGRQPIANEDRSVHVTCNGEIYNFRALRKELRRRGHSFRTHSDVEVIVHLYEERGDAFVDALQGMFAIALWDGRSERLLLARDRLGVKPLYWAEVDGGLIYGSEPGALLASGLVAREPDATAIAQYLTLQYVPPPLTGYAGMRKLRPGERLVYERGGPRLERFWRLPAPPPAPVEEHELLARTDELVRDATRCRLMADVPLGAFLSGGIDSTLVVGYMAEHTTQVRTFSMDFPEVGYSERESARRVALLYGTAHQEFLLEPDLVPAVAEAAHSVGEPFADPSLVPTSLLSRETRRHVKVALSGDGGDEAFGGYWRYRRAHRGDRLRALRFPARVAVALAGSRRGGVRERLAVVSQTPHDRYASAISHFQPSMLERVAEPEFLEAAGGSRRAWDEVLSLPADGDGVNVYMRLDIETYLPGALLTKVDRASMAHGLEVRSPFLDYRVLEHSAAIPAHLKLHHGTGKWLLRQLAAQRGVPGDLVMRAKKGFSMPIGLWFRGRLRPWLADVLFDPRTRGRGYFREAEVRRLFDEHMSGRADHTSRLWNLTMLELWHREWIDG